MLGRLVADGEFVNEYYQVDFEFKTGTALEKSFSIHVDDALPENTSL
ncbi:hypothetical protein [Vibrio lentus]|nr:hypothetical protein [Vibrio lentus]